jgi:hypothetical protein
MDLLDDAAHQPGDPRHPGDPLDPAVLGRRPHDTLAGNDAPEGDEVRKGAGGGPDERVGRAQEEQVDEGVLDGFRRAPVQAVRRRVDQPVSVPGPEDLAHTFTTRRSPLRVRRAVVGAEQDARLGHPGQEPVDRDEHRRRVPRPVGTKPHEVAAPRMHADHARSEAPRPERRHPIGDGGARLEVPEQLRAAHGQGPVRGEAVREGEPFRAPAQEVPLRGHEEVLGLPGGVVRVGRPHQLARELVDVDHRPVAGEQLAKRRTACRSPGPDQCERSARSLGQRHAGQEHPQAIAQTGTGEHGERPGPARGALG